VSAGWTVSQVLRGVLAYLRVPLWCEVFSGLSWTAFKSLDVYFSIRTAAYDAKPKYLVKFLVHDIHDGITYTPEQTQWWSYSHWQAVGQVPNEYEYGPSIRIDPGFLGQISSEGIIPAGMPLSMGPEVFCDLIDRYPQLWVVALRTRMHDFAVECMNAAKGKGRGKGKLMIKARM
jgi:hypothetical protein